MGACWAHNLEVDGSKPFLVGGFHGGSEGNVASVMGELWNTSHCDIVCIITAYSAFQMEKKRKRVEKSIAIRKKNYSREWFRSIDLWVMGPARSHCATLLAGSVLCLSTTLNRKLCIACTEINNEMASTCWLILALL